MSGTTLKICRLCLKTSKDLEVITESEKDIIQIVIPQLNLDISDNPAICTDCANVLQQSFAFKSKCLEIEDSIHDFKHDENEQVNLEKILGVSEDNSVKCIKICRTCLSYLENNTFTELCKGHSLFKYMVQKCLPEMNIKLTMEPVLCQRCEEALKTFYNFHTLCLNTEEKIKFHFENSNKNCDLNLNDIVQYECGKDNNRDININVGYGEQTTSDDVNEDFSSVNEIRIESEVENISSSTVNILNIQNNTDDDVRIISSVIINREDNDKGNVETDDSKNSGCRYNTRKRRAKTPVIIEEDVSASDDNDPDYSAIDTSTGSSEDETYLPPLPKRAKTGVSRQRPQIPKKPQVTKTLSQIWPQAKFCAYCYYPAKNDFDAQKHGLSCPGVLSKEKIPLVEPKYIVVLMQENRGTASTTVNTMKEITINTENTTLTRGIVEKTGTVQLNQQSLVSGIDKDTAKATEETNLFNKENIVLTKNTEGIVSLNQHSLQYILSKNDTAKTIEEAKSGTLIENSDCIIQESNLINKNVSNSENVPLTKETVEGADSNQLCLQHLLSTQDTAQSTSTSFSTQKTASTQKTVEMANLNQLSLRYLLSKTDTVKTTNKSNSGTLIDDDDCVIVVEESNFMNDIRNKKNVALTKQTVQRADSNQPSLLYYPSVKSTSKTTRKPRLISILKKNKKPSVKEAILEHIFQKYPLSIKDSAKATVKANSVKSIEDNDCFIVEEESADSVTKNSISATKSSTKETIEKAGLNMSNRLYNLLMKDTVKAINKSNVEALKNVDNDCIIVESEPINSVDLTAVNVEKTPPSKETIEKADVNTLYLQYLSSIKDTAQTTNKPNSKALHVGNNCIIPERQLINSIDVRSVNTEETGSTKEVCPQYLSSIQDTSKTTNKPNSEAVVNDYVIAEGQKITINTAKESTQKKGSNEPCLQNISMEDTAKNTNEPYSEGLNVFNDGIIAERDIINLVEVTAVNTEETASAKQAIENVGNDGIITERDVINSVEITAVNTEETTSPKANIENVGSNQACPQYFSSIKDTAKTTLEQNSETLNVGNCVITEREVINTLDIPAVNTEETTLAKDTTENVGSSEACSQDPSSMKDTTKANSKPNLDPLNADTDCVMVESEQIHLKQITTINLENTSTPKETTEKAGSNKPCPQYFFFTPLTAVNTEKIGSAKGTVEAVSLMKNIAKPRKKTDSETLPAGGGITAGKEKRVVKAPSEAEANAKIKAIKINDLILRKKSGSVEPMQKEIELAIENNKKKNFSELSVFVCNYCEFNSRSFQKMAKHCWAHTSESEKIVNCIGDYRTVFYCVKCTRSFKAMPTSHRIRCSQKPDDKVFLFRLAKVMHCTKCYFDSDNRKIILDHLLNCGKTETIIDAQ